MCTPLLFIINLKLALLSIVIVPLTGVVVVIIGKSIRRRSKRTAEKIARIMGMMSENLNSIRIVKSFAMEAFETVRFKKEQERHYALDLRQARLRLVSSPITEMIGAFIAVMHSGVTLAPLVGELLASEMLQATKSSLLNSFRPIRFSG